MKTNADFSCNSGYVSFSSDISHLHHSNIGFGFFPTCSSFQDELEFCQLVTLNANSVQGYVYDTKMNVADGYYYYSTFHLQRKKQN